MDLATMAYYATAKAIPLICMTGGAALLVWICSAYPAPTSNRVARIRWAGKAEFWIAFTAAYALLLAHIAFKAAGVAWPTVAPSAPGAAAMLAAWALASGVLFAILFRAADPSWEPSPTPPRTGAGTTGSDG